MLLCQEENFTQQSWCFLPMSSLVPRDGSLSLPYDCRSCTSPLETYIDLLSSQVAVRKFPNGGATEATASATTQLSVLSETRGFHSVFYFRYGEPLTQPQCHEIFCVERMFLGVRVRVQSTSHSGCCGTYTSAAHPHLVFTVARDSHAPVTCTFSVHGST